MPQHDTQSFYEFTRQVNSDYLRSANSTKDGETENYVGRKAEYSEMD
jgi:hypothetical protein